MRLVYFASALVLAGCSLSPRVDLPESPLPPAYDLATRRDTTGAVPLNWEEVYPDPRLRALVQAALTQNHDLRTALLNVEIARSQYGIQRASSFPSVDAGLGFARQHLPQATTATPPDTKSISANLSVPAYELDLFGRVRSQSQAAFQRYLASEAGSRAARATVIGSVVESYLLERLAGEQLAITEATLQDFKASYKLTEQLYKASQATQLELAQAEGLVRQAEADLEGRKRDLATATNALSLIVGGVLPSTLPDGLFLSEQRIPSFLPAGSPSDLLLNRPDIVQAEYDLRAANADIGAARAAFFPSITLTGAAGITGDELKNLFNGANRSWSFTPQLTVPIFRTGALKHALTVSELRRDVAVVAYEKAIASAFREVSDGLAGRETYDRQIVAQAMAVEVSNRRLALAEQRYRSGLDSRLEWLDAQRAHYAARQALNELRYRGLLSSTSLFKALGGGGANRTKFAPSA